MLIGEKIGSNLTKKRIRLAIVYLVCIIAAILIVFIRKPNFDETGFRNEDAPYHVLLTISAYEENDVSIHSFLPIVTLGGDENKYIQWGATIPDEIGNNYYTSFSNACFVLPYLFFEILSLPVSLDSLYLFNSCLYIISLMLAVTLFQRLFRGKIPDAEVAFLVAAIYLCAPEILHSQGAAYWHQSVYQVCLLLQMHSFLSLKEGKKRWPFLLMCLIGPYVEWTGYVANFAFAIAIIWEGRKNREPWKRFVGLIALLTVTSAILYTVPLILKVGVDNTIVAIVSRFAARSTSSGSILLLLFTYIFSYAFLWPVVLAGGLYLLLDKKNKNRASIINERYSAWVIGFVLTFPLLENIVMLEHAYEYSFDRVNNPHMNEGACVPTGM